MTTPCYYCEEDRQVACLACIHGEHGPEIEQVIAWRAAPPPAADAVSVDALMEMVQEYASAWSMVGGPFDRGDWLDDAAYAKERLRRAIVAALAARGK